MLHWVWVKNPNPLKRMAGHAFHASTPKNEPPAPRSGGRSRPAARGAGAVSARHHAVARRRAVRAPAPAAGPPVASAARVFPAPAPGRTRGGLDRFGAGLGGCESW